MSWQLFYDTLEYAKTILYILSTNFLIMGDTLQFQCRNCGHISERPKNPKVCPVCGETVMKPVELSEPGSEQNSLATEDFDVDSALSELKGMKSPISEGTVGTSDSDKQGSNHESPSSESSEDSDGSGFLSLLKSLF